MLLTLRERDLELRPPAARVLLVRHVAELQLVGGPEVFSGVVLKVIVCENSKRGNDLFSPARFRSILRRASWSGPARCRVQGSWWCRSVECRKTGLEKRITIFISRKITICSLRGHSPVNLSSILCPCGTFSVQVQSEEVEWFEGNPGLVTTPLD